MKNTIVIIAVMALFASCKDSNMAQFKALGKPHIVTLFGCDGKVLGKWETTGSVSNEQHSDGWYFEDVKTGKLIEITGTIMIEVK